MSIKVLIPTPLRLYAGKQSIFEVAAQTVGEALSDLVVRYPDLRRHLFSEDGKLRLL
jgi:adenylyltransferase/sulfurtransferase